MGRYFDCTLYATAEDPRALDAAVTDGEEAASRQAIRDGRPPQSGPAIDQWSSERVGSCSWHAALTVIDMDASAWTAELATRNPTVRFDLIQVEGIDILYPEGIRFNGSRQLTGVPLFVPGSSPGWALVEEGIKAFNPDDPQFIDGSWDLLEAPSMGLLPGDEALDGSETERETLEALAGGLQGDLNLVRAAFESAEIAPVERPDGAFVLALLSPDVSVGRPEVYVGPDGIVPEWQPKNEEVAAAVARLLIVGALKKAGMDAPMPL